LKKSPLDVTTEVDLEEEAEETVEETAETEHQEKNRCALKSETMENVITKIVDSILVVKLTDN